MNILLIGEYSRLHNSLKEGLQKSGHRVQLLGFNDGFKNFPVDFKLQKQWDSGFLKKIKVLVYKLSGFDITSFLTYRQFIKNKSLFSGFDIVQLINENSFYCDYHFEKKILQHIFNSNEKVFLLSCGTDYVNVKYGFDHPEFKSVIQPYLLGKIPDENFQGVLKFRHDDFRKLHEFIYKNINGVIASDMDYHLPLINNPKYSGLIPNPVNIEKFPFEPLDILGPIVIFLGINTENYYKKGCDFFEKALEIIALKYPEKVDIIITRNLPYDQYIQSYKKAHILLDQAYSTDQGYNAIEAMARGKAVFTGAGNEFADYYRLSGKVAVNALPDVDYLVNELSLLIENPDEVAALGKRASEFIRKEHDYIKIADQYLKTWQ